MGIPTTAVSFRLVLNVLNFKANQQLQVAYINSFLIKLARQLLYSTN